MMRGALFGFLAAPFLFACAPTALEIDTLGPPAIPAKFAADVEFCRTQTVLYKAKPSLDSVAGATLQGGSQNLSYLPLNAAIPVLGAAGGGAYEAQKGFDLTGQVHRNVFMNCVRDLSNRDQSAVVADPRP